jgi:phosphoribosylaminoimidazole (AIR) synthetase
MYRTYNMGIGFLIICTEQVSRRLRKILPEARKIGQVTGTRDVAIRINGRDVQIEKW